MTGAATTAGAAAARCWLVAACLLILTAATVTGCAAVASTTAAPSTYYLSPSGSDAAAGTSPATAWRTLGRASAAILGPGSRLLLQGGGRFTGQLTVAEKDAGDPSDPVTIGSYGAGLATIANPSGSGIYVHDTGGVDIQGIDLAGPGSPTGQSAGIGLYNDLPAGHRLAHVVIADVDVSGFGNGVVIAATNQRAGFTGVTVSDSSLHDNVYDGLIAYGPAFSPRSPSYAHQNVQVSHVRAYRNRGNPRDKANNSGNGIVLGSVSGGTVAWSTASGNGGVGAAVRGRAGIWTYDSTGITIEHDLAFGNMTPNHVDGNGFGLDQNTSDSVLEDNLSYGNYGTGYLVYSSLNDQAETGNIVRGNISSGDAIDGNPYYGGITVIGWVKDIAVDQNTVVMDPSEVWAPAALRIGPTSLRGVSVRDNIFVAGPGPVVATSTRLTATMAQFQGNDYFSGAAPWRVAWGKQVYTSLAGWRAGTSQEITRGEDTGLDADPYLAGPVLGLRAQLATDTSARAGFAPRPGSPVIGAAVDLTRPGTAPAPSASHPSIGAE